MAAYVLDTHALAWYFEDSHRLSKRVKDLLTFGEDSLVIPTIVICELVFLSRKDRFAFDLSRFRNIIDEDKRFSVYPLDAFLSLSLPPHLEMHDAIIVGTANQLSQKGQSAFIVSRDRQIAEHADCPIVW